MKKSLKKSRTLGIARDKPARGIWPFLNNFSTKMFGNQQRQLLEYFTLAAEAQV